MQLNIELLEETLKEKKMSRYRLAKTAGVSTSTIIRLMSGENQNPTFDTVAKIADTLQISLDRLARKGERNAVNK